MTGLLTGIDALTSGIDVRALVPLPVIIPLLAAGVKFVVPPRFARTHHAISIAALSIVLALALVLLRTADQQGPQVVRIGGWTPPVGIVLVADRLSALMLVISSAVTLAVLVYSIGQGIADQDEVTPLAVFHPTYLVLVAGVSNAFLAGDLFNLYVGFEILLAASYVLITLGGTAPRIRSGTTYVVVGIVSSMVFLLAIAMIYAATGTLNLAQIAERLSALSAGQRLGLEALLLLGFGIKAAVFPLSSWLPDSYPTAPAPVTAVFAGLLTKVGVYAILRTETLLFPQETVKDVLMWVALLTMVGGILGAVAQTDVKRLLSFTLVSHIGYMIFGVALMTEAGLAGAVFYVVHHITVQTGLFLVAGLMERRGGSSSLQRLSGLAKLSPLLAVLYLVPALNLAGIPPLSGFIGKLGIIQAGVAEGEPLAYVLVAGSLATSLLTLMAMTEVWNRAFWQKAPDESGEGTDGGTAGGGPAPGVGRANGPVTSAIPLGARSATERYGRPRAGSVRTAALSGTAVTTGRRIPVTMWAATAGLVALGVSFTVFAGPLVGLAHRTAGELRDRGEYIGVVAPQQEERAAAAKGGAATGGTTTGGATAGDVATGDGATAGTTTSAPVVRP